LNSFTEKVSRLSDQKLADHPIQNVLLY